MKKEHKARLLNNIHALSHNITDNDFDLNREYLEDLGVNVEELSTRGIKELKKISFLSKASINQRRDKSILEKIHAQVRESIKRNAELTGEVLRNALSERKASFQFRNIENLSEEELREVLGDIDMVKLLEDLENLKD